MVDSDFSDYSIRSEQSSRSITRRISESSQSNFSLTRSINRRKNEHIYKQKLKEVDSYHSESSDSDFVTSKKFPGKKSGKKRAQILSGSDDDDDNEVKQVYCVCKTSDVSRFMIACDNCEEWFHGDCESITPTFSKKIKNYYCVGCRRKNPNLRIQLKPQYTKKSVDEIPFQEEQSRIPSPPPVSHPKMKQKDVQSESEFELDEYDDIAQEKKKKKEKPQQKRKYQRKQTKPKGKIKKKFSKAGKKKTTKKTTEKKDKKTPKTSSKKSRNRTLSEDSEEEIKTNSPRQCFGPGCVKMSRKGSKYCCDDCGMSLATKRIKVYVPNRLAEWGQAPCAADELSKRELETIRKERSHALEILSDINKKQDELESIIVRGRNTEPYTEEECTDIIDNETDGDVAVSCPTCSQETTLKVALKHMEKCFNKVESRTSFCSAVKPKVENQRVFCDYLNPVNGTYCKRLRLLCPEHSKDIRGTGVCDDVCGCPLRTNKNPFQDGETYCRMLKKKCTTHYGWEKFRQASLDAQKIQQWLKLDELYEREQKIMSSLNARHGLIQLLLHRTVLHSL